jgi:ligand-binding SRPBCC domain-containing protein
VHTHEFEDEGDETVIRDSVSYRLPFAPLSELAHPLVRAQIARIFRFRERAIRAWLSTQTPNV